jgi:hypothetical protein
VPLLMAPNIGFVVLPLNKLSTICLCRPSRLTGGAAAHPDNGTGRMHLATAATCLGHRHTGMHSNRTGDSPGNGQVLSIA